MVVDCDSQQKEEIGTCLATHMQKLTQIAVSREPKFYWGRPLGYRKKWNFALLRQCTTTRMSCYLSICQASCSHYSLINRSIVHSMTAW